jgi:hypothetical protein
MPVAHHRRTISEPSSSPKLHVLPAVHSRVASLPVPIIAIDDDSCELEFDAICADSSITFNPHKLGFIPLDAWEDRDFTFGELVRSHFRKKCSLTTRFFHKLFNALKIVESDSFYSVFLGIEWASHSILKVDKKSFARLLGIKTIDGSLFHCQGNFPSHGFREIGVWEAKGKVSEENLLNVDFDCVRLLVHATGLFVRGANSDVVEHCKWVNSRRR